MRADPDPVVEILGVSHSDPDELRFAGLNRPGEGSTTNAFVLDMAGTVIPREGRAQAVEVAADGVPLKELPISFPRADVARTFPGVPEDTPCGFRGLLGALRLGLEFELELRAVLDSGQRIPFASLTGRRARPRVSFEPALRPLMVTGLGRSGTTWLMGMLGAHPRVVVDATPPYERMPARYWAHMLNVLCDPTDSVPTRASLLDPDSAVVPPNPYYGLPEAGRDELGQWLGRTYVEGLASFCVRNIDDWYTIATREQGKENVAYFAEKNFLSRPRPAQPVSELYRGVKEVFLVRDFRDMACSWDNFFADRSFGSVFGKGKLSEEVMPALVQRLSAEWRKRRDRAHLVRYEDLVFRPREAVEGLLRHLEIDSSEETVTAMIRSGAENGGFEFHGTSPSLEQTVGRWRSTGDEPFREGLNAAFRDPLIEFGYL